MATHSSILAWRIPMDRGAWQATVPGVTKNWTQLSDTHTQLCCTSGLLAPSHHSQVSSLLPVHPGRVGRALPQCLPSGLVIPECSRIACFRALAAPLTVMDRHPDNLVKVFCLDHCPLCFPRSARTSGTASTVWI